METADGSRQTIPRTQTEGAAPKALPETVPIPINQGTAGIGGGCRLILFTHLLTHLHLAAAGSSRKML